jgi:iron(III) transport system permease protein
VVLLKRLPLFFVLFLLFAPLLFLAEAWFLPVDKSWNSFIETEYLGFSSFDFSNSIVRIMGSTLIFSLGTVLLSLVFGIIAAYIMAFYRFPLHTFFQWALILPLAFPAYILGFTYLGLFEPTGVIQSFLRDCGVTYMLPNIRNQFGAILFKSFTLFPYIYLLAKVAFSTQSNHVIETAKILGYSPNKIFLKVILPLSWPWIFSGMMLVFMEAISDYGMVALFNVDTLTTFVYQKWEGEKSLLSATRISFMILIIIIFIYYLQNHYKGARKVFLNVKEGANFMQVNFSNRILQAGHFSYILILFLFSFLMPVALLTFWTYKNFQINGLNKWLLYFSESFKSFLLSLVAACLITAITIVLALYDRNIKSKFLSSILKISTIGYALPGTLLGICVFAFLHFFEIRFGIILKASLLGLLIGYLIRFNAVSHENVFSAYERVPPSLDESGFLLGNNIFQVFRKIHFPLVKASLFSSVLLVFVDVMKELPLTLIMRPSSFDTLPIKIYGYSSDGDWVSASLPALLLILVGVIPIILLTKYSSFQSKRA